MISKCAIEGCKNDASVINLDGENVCSDCYLCLEFEIEDDEE